MRIIFMGTPVFSVQILEALAAAGHEIIAVYTQPPRRAGRGQAERRSPVHMRALDMHLAVRTPGSFKDQADRDEFAALHAEIAVVVAYGLILPQSILDSPGRGCLNIHASLLPRWRGAAPIQRAIMAGDRETGVCILQMQAALDAGPVLVREATAIAAGDTYGSVHDRLAAMGAGLIVRTLAELPIPALAQPLDGVSYARKIDKAEARIDWTRPAVDVDAHIRSLSPFPGAWTMADGQRVKVLLSERAPGDGQPGRALANDLTVACGTGAVRLLRLQRDGRAAMAAGEFQRGFPIVAGATLS